MSQFLVLPSLSDIVHSNDMPSLSPAWQWVSKTAVTKQVSKVNKSVVVCRASATCVALSLTLALVLPEGNIHPESGTS